MPKQLHTIPNPMMMWYSTPYYYYQHNRHNTLESGQRKRSRRITVGTLWNNQRMIWNKFRILYPHWCWYYYSFTVLVTTTSHTAAMQILLNHRQSHPRITTILCCLSNRPLLPREATYVVWRYISHCKFAIFILPSLILLLLWPTKLPRGPP